MQDHEPRTLITGATGFLGRNLLFRMLEREEEGRICLLVRGQGKSSPRDRLHRILDTRYSKEQAAAYKKRIDLILGDVTWKHFGMDDRTYSRLAGRVERVIHGAASVLFDLPLEMARSINVEGTRNLLDFAAEAHRMGTLRRMDYVGTAYVAGKRKGLVTEDELDEGQAFNNTYEQTKLEAERLVRERWGELPLAVYRPSIVVGESTTGRTSSFNVLYYPLKIYARGIWRWIPGNPEVPVDIVPVDFVCDALERISLEPDSVGSCYHLTASKNATTIGHATKMAATYFGAKPVRFISPSLYLSLIHPVAAALPIRRVRETVANNGPLFYPYFISQPRFDNKNARSFLEKNGLEAPKVEEYFARIFQFCIDTDWGRRVPEKED
jgi:thioester reductase-like protein